MKRLVFFAAVQMILGALWAQGQIVSTRVYTEPPNGWFYVDGQVYQSSATFLWPEGSKHTLSAAPPQQTPAGMQVSCSQGGWVNSNGTSLPGTSVVVTASSEVAYYKLGGCSVEYAVRVEFSNDTVGGLFSCDLLDANHGRVVVGGACFDHNRDMWMAAGEVPLQAYPPPGFVFVGWTGNGIQSATSWDTRVNIVGPTLIYARFAPAVNVSFQTVPPELKVLVDHAAISTPQTFDWAAYSVHSIGPVANQMDQFGGYWVFDSWAHGGDASQLYEVGEANAPVSLTARYVQGVKVSFATDPVGLKLNIDGQDWFLNYNFVWGLGSTHHILAPLEQTGPDGRKYTFNSWSTPGGNEQDYTVETMTSNGAVAHYDAQGQLKIESLPGGLDVTVDGQACHTPCVIDRPAGTQVAISAPEKIQLTDSIRLVFASFSDGGPRERTWTAGQTADHWVMNYNTQNRVLALADPAPAATFQFDPTSPDGFYAAGTNVTVTAVPNDGYKFKWWEGDLQSLFKSVTVNTSRSYLLRAMFDRVPFVAPTGVRNGAGNTPENAVAPGSIITIYGGALTVDSEVGPASPLAQTLAGITVQVADRLLPLFFASPAQINAQLPTDLPEGEYKVTVRGAGQPDAKAMFTAQRNAPGIFSQAIDDKLYAIAMHADGAAVTPEDGAHAGETVTVLGTGFGPYKEGSIDGLATPEGVTLTLADAVTIQAGDKTLTPVAAKSAVGYVGITAIQFQIPNDLPAGTSVELKMSVNGHESNTVLLPIQ